MLDTVLTGPVDIRVREEIIAEAGGNPLALLELPRGLTPGELAGGFGLPGVLALSGRIEETFQRRVTALPADSRRLLLLAAAEPLGEPLLVWQAADNLGIERAAANPAVDAGLVVFGARVRFRHPLVRSAVYRLASAHERQEAHRALAEVTDPVRDPDRRAWHRAQATPGPEEDVAAELERSAGRAQARGGFAAAAAFLERAAVLTPDPAKRSARALAAAQAKVQAGAVDAGLDLLAMAEAGPLGEFERARADLVRAQIAYVTRRVQRRGTTAAERGQAARADRSRSCPGDLRRRDNSRRLRRPVCRSGRFFSGCGARGQPLLRAGTYCVRPPPRWPDGAIRPGVHREHSPLAQRTERFPRRHASGAGTAWESIGTHGVRIFVG